MAEAMDAAYEVGVLTFEGQGPGGIDDGDAPAGGRGPAGRRRVGGRAPPERAVRGPRLQPPAHEGIPHDRRGGRRGRARRAVAGTLRTRRRPARWGRGGRHDAGPQEGRPRALRRLRARAEGGPAPGLLGRPDRGRPGRGARADGRCPRRRGGVGARAPSPLTEAQAAVLNEALAAGKGSTEA